jgi:hypothetical protein
MPGKQSELDPILDLWAEGYSAPEIAEKLGSNQKRVDNLVQEARRAGRDERACPDNHRVARARRNDFQRRDGDAVHDGIPGAPLLCAEMGIERVTGRERMSVTADPQNRNPYIRVSLPRLKFLEEGA